MKRISFLLFLAPLFLSEDVSRAAKADVTVIRVECPDGFVPCATDLHDHWIAASRSKTGLWELRVPRDEKFYLGFTGLGIIMISGTDFLYPRKVSSIPKGSKVAFPAAADVLNNCWDANVRFDPLDPLASTDKLKVLYIEGASAENKGEIRQVVLPYKTMFKRAGFLALPKGEYNVALLPSTIVLGDDSRAKIKKLASNWMKITVTEEDVKAKAISIDLTAREQAK